MAANPKFDPIYLTPAKPKGTYDFDTIQQFRIMEEDCANLDRCRCAHPIVAHSRGLRETYLVCDRCNKIIVNARAS